MLFLPLSEGISPYVQHVTRSISSYAWFNNYYLDTEIVLAVIEFSSFSFLIFDGCTPSFTFSLVCFNYAKNTRFATTGDRRDVIENSIYIFLSNHHGTSSTELQNPRTNKCGLVFFNQKDLTSISGAIFVVLYGSA